MKIVFGVKEKLRLSRLIQSERINILNTNKLMEKRVDLLKSYEQNNVFKGTVLKVFKL